MKHVTINVSEPVYKELQEYAKRHDRSASGLIREAMEIYLHERVQRGTSVRDLPPLSLGKVKKPLTRNDDLLEEMTHAPRR